MPLPALGLAPIVVTLSGALGAMLAGLVPRILFALGIGFATFTGFQVALTSLKSAVISNMQGLPATVVGYLGVMKVDQGLSLIMSATLAVAATRMVAGALTRVTMKGTA